MPEENIQSQRGGRRPGAGAPKGNLNGPKTGEHSMQPQALQGTLEAMPMTAGLLGHITGKDRRKITTTPICSQQS